MPEVILEGPGAGMTVGEYEAKRAIDCKVAQVFGWKRDLLGQCQEKADCDAAAFHWYKTPQGFGVMRDDDGGIPYFSFDMNGAWEVVGLVVKTWSYLARQKFWELLQRRAGQDPVVLTFPVYPDVFETLVSSLHEDICHAFLETAEYHGKRNMSLVSQSVRAANFKEGVEVEYFEETQTLEDGTTRIVKRAKAMPTSAPWVRPALEGA